MGAIGGGFWVLLLGRVAIYGMVFFFRGLIRLVWIKRVQCKSAAVFSITE